MESSAYSPAHITGLVQVYECPNNGIYTGSKGVGFSIQKGVTTYVKATLSTDREIKIKINGKLSTEASVSELVAKSLMAKTRYEHKVSIRHEIEIPIGVGFGTSGAAALSLALALNDALELGLSRIESAQVAHLAEVTCRTGFGTVAAEMQGGFEVRTKPGAPGVGHIVSIPLSGDYVMIALVLGKLSTVDMLRELMSKKEWCKQGERLLNQFLSDRSVENFLRLSNRFSRVLRLCPRLEDILKETDEAGYVCSIALFGENVFTLIKDDEKEGIEEIFKKHSVNGSNIFISRIENSGARLL